MKGRRDNAYFRSRRGGQAIKCCDLTACCPNRKIMCFDELRKEGRGYRDVGKLTNTDRIMRDTFWVGVYPGMTEEMMDFMVP